MKLAEKRKVLFIDTENSFSVERLKQISPSIDMETISLIKVSSFKKQYDAISLLEKTKLNFDLIIVDSFNHFYRKEIQSGKDVNPFLSRQLSVLSSISKKGVPVILTAQVYTTQNNTLMPVGGNMLKNWCPVILSLNKEPLRTAMLEKHSENINFKSHFKITEKGIILTKCA